MTTLVFDLDDTLYDQLLPFKKAVQKSFSFPADQIEDLYLMSRKYSDEVFELTHSGKMSLVDMHVYRIQNACAQWGMDLTFDQALCFQKAYQSYQDQISLFDNLARILTDCCQRDIQLVLMTNGPTEHQYRKIRQLDLTNWIPAEKIFISEKVGFSKPDRRFFDYVSKQLSLKERQTYYVGDSYENDIVGAKRANWQAVWFNHRNHLQPTSNYQYDYLLTDSNSLLSFVANL
ncbi:MAG TPA: HAD family hydrolase [Tetragenococcus sp.]|nr:HAD family hydrolase [Tetragenococcus sp.]